MFVGTCLVDMYGKCGKIGDARKVFDGMSKKNTVMVVGYVKVGDMVEAKRLFDEMPQRNVGDLGNARVVLDAMLEKSVASFMAMQRLVTWLPQGSCSTKLRKRILVSLMSASSQLVALYGFEHVYGDIVSGVIDVNELGFLVKHMEGMVRKMDRYEQAMNKFQNNQNEESRRVFEQKLAWQRQYRNYWV
ncbi:hypothetical protein Ahy_B05g078608 [Arachis hypogaea]|uniref:Pentatricopeptide repeat-containing protein n=1 Tax=Arachis hypogaea TaxID=3818 RepID=A0A444Z7M4_ARAHY|nr:hypothetical protein Ahy_B05g078608 [Arachis hypogaea]